MQLTIFFFHFFYSISLFTLIITLKLLSVLSSSHLSHISSSRLSHLPAHAVAVPCCRCPSPRRHQPMPSQPTSSPSQPTPPSPPHFADPRLRPVLRSDPRHLSILFVVIEFVWLFVFLMCFHMGLVVVVE